MSNPPDPDDSHAPEPPDMPHPELNPPEQLGFELSGTPGSVTPPPGTPSEDDAPPPAGPGHDAGLGTPPAATPGHGPVPPGYGMPGGQSPSGAPPYGGQPYGAPPDYETGAGYGPDRGGLSAPGVPSPYETGPARYGSPTWADPSAPGTHGYDALTGHGAGYAGMPPGYDRGGYGRPAPGYGGYQPTAPGYGYPPPGYGPQPPYASWLQRVGAALIDGIIIGIPALIFYIIGFSVGMRSLDCTTDANGSSVCTGGGLTGVGWTLVLIGWLIVVCGGLYLTYLVGTTGQTPGKKVLGIKLIREADGQFMGFGMAFVRNLCHILDSFCYIGYLWPLWDQKRQTFADMIMKTIVVKA